MILLYIRYYNIRKRIVKKGYLLRFIITLVRLRISFLGAGDNIITKESLARLLIYLIISRARRYITYKEVSKSGLPSLRRVL